MPGSCCPVVILKQEDEGITATFDIREASVSRNPSFYTIYKSTGYIHSKEIALGLDREGKRFVLSEKSPPPWVSSRVNQETAGSRKPLYSPASITLSPEGKRL